MGRKRTSRRWESTRFENVSAPGAEESLVAATIADRSRAHATVELARFEKAASHKTRNDAEIRSDAIECSGRLTPPVAAPGKIRGR